MDPNIAPNTPQIDPQVANIVKALALTEGGGKVNIKNPKAGQSGELASIFQFTPGTWKMYSKEVTGQDNLPMNAQNEAAVTAIKVQNWLKQGLSPEEIASVWNSGKPDAYLHGVKGTNKYGVNYDVPGYVEKFKKYLSQADKGASSAPSQPQVAQTPKASAKPLPLASANTNTLPAMMQRNIKQANPKQVRSV